MSPNPSAAPVCKVRLCYAKRGKLRFTSHRDVARAFERALRRAGLPMAYSQGYHPHPKVSWLGAAPTGAASRSTVSSPRAGPGSPGSRTTGVPWRRLAAAFGRHDRAPTRCLAVAKNHEFLDIDGQRDAAADDAGEA